MAFKMISVSFVLVILIGELDATPNFDNSFFQSLENDLAGVRSELQHIKEIEKKEWFHDVGKTFEDVKEEDKIELCANEEEEIKCPEDSLIKLSEVFYGRANDDICTPSSLGHTCSVSMAQSAVYEKCDMKQSCKIIATPAELGHGDGDCAKTEKYLQVKYHCLPVVHPEILTSGFCSVPLSKEECRQVANMHSTSMTKMEKASDFHPAGCLRRCGQPSDDPSVCMYAQYLWNTAEIGGACTNASHCICKEGHVIEPTLPPTEVPTEPPTEPATTKKLPTAVEAVDLKCHELDMSAKFNTEILPGDILNISVSNCDTDKFEVFNMTAVHVAFEDCANNISQSENVITQENIVAVVNAVRDKTNVVNRIVVYYYKLQCSFDRHLNIHYGKAIFIEDREESFEQRRHTNFAATMEMFTSVNFQHLSISPYKVTAFAPIYMQIRGIHNNELFRFITTSCYATPTSNANDKKQYLFFEDKCKLDNTFAELHHGTKNKFMFKVDAFTFIKMKKVVWFHCDLLICKKESETRECTQMCMNARRRRRRREVAFDETTGVEDTITVKSGQIDWDGENRPLDDQLQSVKNELSHVIEQMKADEQKKQ